MELADGCWARFTGQSGAASIHAKFEGEKDHSSGVAAAEASDPKADLAKKLKWGRTPDPMGSKICGRMRGRSPLAGDAENRLSPEAKDHLHDATRCWGNNRRWAGG